MSQQGKVAISMNMATNLVSTKDSNFFLPVNLQLAFEGWYYTFALVTLYDYAIPHILSGLKLTYYVKYFHDWYVA